MVHSYQYKEAYNAQTGEYDFKHNFEDVKKYFDDSDFVVGNFETTMAGENVGISDYPCFKHLTVLLMQLNMELRFSHYSK